MSEIMTKEKRKQDLGIYYTPEVVVDFIYDILGILKNKEDKEEKRWESRKPKPHYPSVIDPAVGEGIFLKKSLEKGFTQPQYIFGVDIDDEVKEKWEELNLLKSFGSRAELDNHFFHQNGLVPLDQGKVLRYKKGGLQEFDAVVGNPPYGGTGLSEDDLSGKLGESLLGYDIWRYAFAKDKVGQKELLPKGPVSAKKIVDKIKRFPIEILFVERFIQLAKPGGWIAIIIPDGILSNSNLHYVREFIAQRTKVLGIVSLPRDTFKHVGTNAKTSILFLQKYETIDQGDMDYPVMLSSIERLEGEFFNQISNAFRKFYNNGKI